MNPDTLRDYIRAGLVLVPIPAGSKAPCGKGWNLRACCWANPGQVLDTFTGNVGLAHAYSGTCALDVDNASLAGPALAGYGIDLAALLAAPDAVHIRSGRPGRDKLLFRLRNPLPSVNRNGAEGFELRCAHKNGTTAQCVLPPSIHPDTGKPYQWAGDWRSVPDIPADLLALWHRLERATPHVVRSRRGLDRIPKGERNKKLFRLARGFVQKGIDPAGVNDRMQKVNATYCTVPLCATEVDTIAASASRYGAKGCAMIPRELVYSQVWKQLPNAARTVVMLAYCRDDGSDGCTFALTETDFAGYSEIGSDNTLRKARRAAVASGILVPTAEPRSTQAGRIPAMYAIAPKWRFRQPQKVRHAPTAKSASLHSLQPLGSSFSLSPESTPETDKAA
jgi:hypothetical protein